MAGFVWGAGAGTTARAEVRPGSGVGVVAGVGCDCGRVDFEIELASISSIENRAAPYEFEQVGWFVGQTVRPANSGCEPRCAR